MTNALFNQLEEWSQQEDSYTIRDFAKSIGTTCKAFYDLSKENEDWEDEFHIARTRLALHAEEARNALKISVEDFSRYVYENDGLLKEADFDLYGIAIPEVAEDEEAFDKWHEERFKLDAIKYGY